MPFLNISIPITNSETEEINTASVCESTGLAKKQTYIGILFTIRTTYASTLTGGSQWCFASKGVNVSSGSVSYRPRKVWVLPQCTVTLTMASPFRKIDEYLLYILAVALQGPSSRKYDLLFNQGALSINQHRSRKYVSVYDFLWRLYSPCVLLLSNFLIMGHLGGSAS